MAAIPENLIQQILDTRRSIHDQTVQRQVLMPYDAKLAARHELLFFLKPEVTCLLDEAFERVLTLCNPVLDQFGVSVKGCLVMGGPYLAEHQVMDRHYGVINEIARRGKAALGDAPREKFQSLFGESIDQANVMGAFELLEAHPSVTPDGLDEIWENSDTEKLAGGTYCAKVEIEGDTIYLLNGFHPKQLREFTGNKQTIVVMPVQSDSDWAPLRQQMIGATNPQKAEDGSIRRQLLEHQTDLGIATVDQGHNGVHLSAGPFEAIGEVCRFVSGNTVAEKLEPPQTALGEWFVSQGISPAQLEAAVRNQSVEIDGQRTSVFDETEEQNADHALAWVKANL